MICILNQENVYVDRQRYMLNGYSNYSYERIENKGKLEDLDVSEEINACSINVMLK